MNYDEMFYKYGMFSEYIPTCFNSDDLFDNIKKVSTSYCSNLKSDCEELAIYKTETTRRIIRVPNPEQYVCLCENLKKNVTDIKDKISLNSHTESNPFRKNKNNEFIDIPLYCELMNIKSEFMKSIKNRIRYSMGYKYELKIDISTFYDSIYTHIIEWCVVGKENAKKRKQNNWGSELDRVLRNCQSGETKGIPTGPITSRLISEYILAFIDDDLKNKGFVFRHYVDDYKFYFRTEAEAISGLKVISNIFRDYRLNINEDKIKINKYPYDIQSSLNQIMYLGRRMNEKESIIYIINECNRLYSDGIDASYKYVLKSLMKLRKGDLAQWEYLESFFLSVLTIKPDLARYISKIIITYKNYVTKEFIIRAKKILMSNVESKNECEVLWVLWLLIILGYKSFSREDLIRLLNLNNDFVRVMVIDFIKNKGINIKSVDFYLSVIENDLVDLEINSSNWLILYESVIKNWFNNPIIKRKVQSNNFFKALLKNKIDFYRIK